MRVLVTDQWSNEVLELFHLEPELVSESYVGWLNDPLVNRYLETRFATADMDSTRSFVARALADPSILFLGIRSRTAGRHVGNIKLGPIDRNHGIGDVGILIGEREAWGKGIASNAIRLLAGIAREQLGLRKLTAGCYASNIGSMRAFENAGFQIEARRAAHCILDGKPEDVILMARFL